MHSPPSHSVPVPQLAPVPQAQPPSESQPSPIPAQLTQACPLGAHAKADCAVHRLSWQQPELQLVELQEHPPLTQKSPELQGRLEPQVQPPSGAQVSVLLAHWKQLEPLTPHWVAVTAVTQEPASLQQPVQELGSQIQVPPWQTYPTPQAMPPPQEQLPTVHPSASAPQPTQAAPLTPQAALVPGEMQVLSDWQQPPSQLEPLQMHWPP